MGEAPKAIIALLSSELHGNEEMSTRGEGKLFWEKLFFHDTKRIVENEFPSNTKKLHSVTKILYSWTEINITKRRWGIRAMQVLFVLS